MHSFLIVGAEQETRCQHALQQTSEHLNVSKNIETHPDVLIVEPENSISIKQIRELKIWVGKTPIKASSKAAIITDAHLATIPAQNALLKTLEEPPATTIIILCAPNSALLLPTIVSRCQIINLKTQPTTSPKDQRQIEAFLKRVSTMSVGERVSAASAYASSRDQAIQFCEALLTILRRQLSKKSTKVIALKQVSLALIRLNANVNPKLVLENLFLKL